MSLNKEATRYMCEKDGYTDLESWVEDFDKLNLYKLLRVLPIIKIHFSAYLFQKMLIIYIYIYVCVCVCVYYESIFNIIMALA